MSDPHCDTQPWTRWFDKLDSPEGIRSRATRRDIRLPDLSGTATEAACEKLSAAWRETYVPNDQHLMVLGKFIERARFVAGIRIASQRAHEDGIYNRTPILLEEPEVWGLTGLAGTGKSSTMSALLRLLTPEPALNQSIPGLHVATAPIIHIKIGPNRATTAVLRSMANPAFVAGRANIKQHELVTHLREWLFVRSSLLILVDELQFLTRSESASTQIANLITELNQLGPAVAYTFNYSLGHKLMLRAHEDKDRLLANTINLRPSREEDQDWRAAIDAYVGVAPALFSIDSRRDAAELHRLTSGLLRLLRLLLATACRLAWPTHPARAVTMADVRAAYGSSAFTSQREVVEALRSLAVNARLRARHKDLINPFKYLPVAPEKNEEPSTLNPPRPLPSPAVMHMLESSISADGRRVLKELRAAASSPPQAERTQRVSQLAPRAKPTAQALLAGAKLLSSKHVGKTLDSVQDEET